MLQILKRRGFIYNLHPHGFSQSDHLHPGNAGQDLGIGSCIQFTGLYDKKIAPAALRNTPFMVYQKNFIITLI